jgi:uncharacterized membrane protein (UPF0127 family)
MAQTKPPSFGNMKTIKNVTRCTVISRNAKLAVSFADRLLGLLNPHNPRYLIFQTRFGIHTFFMNTPIDIILLDNQKKVVKTKIHLLPNKIFLYHPRYSRVIEMPKGTINKCHIRINDKISIE